MGYLDGTVDPKPEIRPGNEDLLDMTNRDLSAEAQRCIDEKNKWFWRHHDAEEIQHWRRNNIPASPEAIESAVRLLIKILTNAVGEPK